MPGGLNESGLIGLAAFPVIKFTGYSLAGYFLKHRYQDPTVSSLKFGAARTALGAFAGIAYVFVVGSLRASGTEFYLGLIPVRIAEWLLIIWMFFDYGSQEKRPAQLAKYSMLGAGWSYILDLSIIVPALLIPDWFWIC